MNNRGRALLCPYITGGQMAEQYFKKPSGVVIKVMPNHDIESLKARFEECDANGAAIKKAAKKAPKKKGVK